MTNSSDATQPTKSKGDLRYRMYFWLIDICLIFVVLALAEFAVRMLTGVAELGLPQPLGAALGVLVKLFVFVVTTVLIFAKPMRDEYAELLWQRTVAHLVNCIAAVPAILLLLVTVAYVTIGGDEPPVWLAWLFELQRPVLLLLWVWTGFLVLFVLIFRINYWLDSR